MCGDNGNLRCVDVRIVEDKLADVVCGYAGIIGLCEAVVFDLDPAVVIEAVDVTAAFTDVDDRSSPLAVFAIVEKVALDKHVARAAAFIPLEGIGFKLNCRAAAVEVVIADNGSSS